MPAPRKITRATYRILRLLLERDDGAMYGLKIARNLPLWQPVFLPPRWHPHMAAAAVTVELMRLERCGWVTGRWEAPPPSIQRPRLRFYSINAAYRQPIIELLESTCR